MGEYRYITFAWRLVKGKHVSIGMRRRNDGDGDEGSNCYYVAGSARASRDSRRVASKHPRQWTVVTRDLAQDFGEFRLTGITLEVDAEGEAVFDRIYLGRSRDDFKDLPEVDGSRRR